METYKLAQLFRIGREKYPYFLARVDNGMCALISIQDGNRFTAPQNVRDADKVTYEELASLCGSSDNDWEFLCQMPEIPVTPDWETIALKYLKEGKFVVAIRECRNITGMSLRDAKSCVENLLEAHGLTRDGSLKP